MKHPSADPWRLAEETAASAQVTLIGGRLHIVCVCVCVDSGQRGGWDSIPMLSEVIIQMKEQ